MPKYKLENSKGKLWAGAVLGTIAHAMFVVHYPELATLQSWDGINYNIQNSAGALGTVTFAENGTVAVFFDAHSSKNPFRSGKGYELESFFEGIPESRFALAQAEALQYVLQEYEGIDRPVVTAVFWSEEEDLVAAVPWSDVMVNGAHLVQIQLLEIDTAIEEWQSEYEISPKQIELVRSLFQRKMTNPYLPIQLNRQEQDVVVNHSATGIVESRELFKNVGIILP